MFHRKSQCECPTRRPTTHTARSCICAKLSPLLEMRTLSGVPRARKAPHAPGASRVLLHFSALLKTTRGPPSSLGLLSLPPTLPSPAEQSLPSPAEQSQHLLHLPGLPAHFRVSSSAFRDAPMSPHSRRHLPISPPAIFHVSTSPVSQMIMHEISPTYLEFLTVSTLASSRHSADMLVPKAARGNIHGVCPSPQHPLPLPLLTIPQFSSLKPLPFPLPTYEICPNCTGNSRVKERRW